VFTKTIGISLAFFLVGCSSQGASTKSSTTLVSSSSSTSVTVPKISGKVVHLNQSLIQTQYFNVDTDEFMISNDARGYGGALLVNGNNLEIGTADGKFLSVDLLTEEIVNNLLPALDMGSGEMPQSKTITYQETLPRLHDLVLHKGYYYATFDQYTTTEDRVRFVVARIRMGEKKWQNLYVSPPLPTALFTLGSGGAIAVDDSGESLYFSVGDFSLDRLNGLPSDFAPQSETLPWGHILKMNLATFRTVLFSKGHRNPLGLSFMSNGRLLSSEMGPRGGDELNLISKGKNYGWPFSSYGTNYGNFFRYGLPQDRSDSFTNTEPIFTFIPSVAPSSLFQSRSFDEAWSGNVVMGSLKAESIFNIKISDERVLFSEQIPIGRRVRDLVESENVIFCLTDNATIIKVSKSKNAEAIAG
jgi:glucose/arabinose dehydrogenase